MSKFDISDELLGKLAKLIEETGLTEIEFEEGDSRLRLTKKPAKVVQATVAAAPALAAAPAPVAAPAGAPAAPAAAAAPIDGFVVESQMVGTAYASPEPDKPAFIAVGDRVSEGQTLLIVEAMKFMNQVPSPKAGVIKEILFTDGEPVEFGQPLVIIGD